MKVNGQANEAAIKLSHLSNFNLILKIPLTAGFHSKILVKWLGKSSS